MSNLRLQEVEPNNGHIKLDNMNSGLFKQIDRSRTIRYGNPGGITREHILLSLIYVTQLIVWGSNFVASSTVELEEDINHFKFLIKYGLC